MVVWRGEMLAGPAAFRCPALGGLLWQHPGSAHRGATHCSALLQWPPPPPQSQHQTHLREAWQGPTSATSGLCCSQLHDCPSPAKSEHCQEAPAHLGKQGAGQELAHQASILGVENTEAPGNTGLPHHSLIHSVIP